MNYEVQNAMIQLSGVCNYRCKMCGHPGANKGRMTDEVFRRTIEDCKASKIKTIIFAGAWGEPTLHPMWKSFVKESVDQGFNTMISTNGSRLDVDAVHFLANSGLKQVQISFAGFSKESYESIYVNGKFAEINDVLIALRTIFNTVPNPPEILVNGVVENGNSTEFVDRTYRYLYSCGYSDAEINLVRPNNFGGKRVKEGGNGHELQSKLLSKSNLQMCTVLRDVVGIFWDGRVTACGCLDNDGRMLIGSVLDESIRDMRKSKLFCEMVECFENKQLDSLEMCSKCDVPYGDERNAKVLPSWNIS